MKNPGRMDYVTRQLVATLFTLSMVILFAGAAQAAINCTQCHGVASTSALPKDTLAASASYRNLTTGAIKGNHETHSGAVTTGQSCARCHGAAAASYTSNHAALKHYSIQMSASMNYNKGAGVVTAFPQSSNPTLGTCSNVNCHFQTITPTWGQQTTFASQKGAGSDASNTCAQCHLGSSLSTGKHAAHISKYSSDLTSCAKCHPDYFTPSGAPAFAHATSNTGSIKMSFAAAPNSGAGSVSGLRTSSNFLPGAATSSSATCSSTYCHKGASVTPAWNGAATNCGSCHDATSTGLSTLHNRHYNSASLPTAIDSTTANTASAYVYGCGTCHASASHVQGAADSTGPVFQDTQVSGTKIDTFTPGAASSATDAKGYNYTVNATCTTICHTRTGDDVLDSPIVAANWSGSFTGSCSVCHKASGESYATMVTNADTGLSSKHNIHIANDRYGLSTTNFTCATCHAGTATDNTTINGASGRNQHPNAATDVAMSAFATGGTVTISGVFGSRTCTNTYCHSNGTVAAGTHSAINWASGSMAAGCAGCHGGNAQAASMISTRVHAQHLFSSARVGKDVSCKDCHAATASDSATISSYTNHVDKNVNVKFDNAAGINKDTDSPTYLSGTSTTGATGATKTPGAAGYTCANLYCHSTGNLGTSGNLINAGGTKFRSVAWNGSAIGCDGCHGNQAGKAHPVYTSGLAGYSTSNSHVKHVESSSLGCDYCHYNTVAQATIPPTQVRMNNFSGHLNRTMNVRFKPNAGKTGSYNVAQGQKNCSNTYCHGTGPSLSWGGTSTCSSCHDASNTGLSTRHDIHYASPTAATVLAGGTDAHTASAYVYACLNCHPTAAHTTGPADSNAPVQDANVTGTKVSGYVKGGTSTPDAKGYNYTQGTCTTVCHTRDGVSLAPVVTAVWSGASTGSCAVCHKGGGETNATMVANGATGLSAVHNKHMASDRYGLNSNFTCATCHAGTASNSTTINGATGRGLHPNANRDVSMTAFATGGTVTIGGTQGNQTCANTYCHSNGTIAAGTHTAINWSGTFSTCAECHGNAASLATGAHDKHVGSLTTVGRAVGCVDCHSATVSGDTTVSGYSYHVNKNTNVRFNNSVNLDTDLPTFATSDARNATAGGASRAVGSAAANCANVYCHSSGNINNAGVAVAPTTYVSVTWNTAAIGCDGCHGGGGKSHPTYASGAAASQTSNSHVKHVDNNAFSCDYCHLNTVTQATIPPTAVRMNNFSGHLNRDVNIRMKLNNGMTGLYNKTAKTCSNTYCHGVSAGPAWGSNSTTCATCHSANSTLPGGHQAHVQTTPLATSYMNMSGNVSTATQYRFSCGACHSSAAGSLHVNGLANANGPAQVLYGFTSATRKATAYNYGGSSAGTDPTAGMSYTAGGTGTCATTYCHSDGNGGIGDKTAFTWAAPSATNRLRCYGCHGAQDWKGTGAQSAQNYSSIRTQAHARHVRGDINTELNTGNGIACYRCHGATVTTAMNSYSTVGTGVLNKKRHVNKMRDYSGVTPNPNGGAAVSSGQFNQSTHLCSNVYCHSNSKAGTSVSKYTSPEAWNSGATLRKCNYCHGRQNHAPSVGGDTDIPFSRYSSTGVPNYTSGTGGSTTANTHRQHMAVIGTTDYSNTNVCYSCHAQTLDSTTGRSASAAKFRAYSSRHTSGAYNVKLKATYGGTYDGTVTTGKTCSTSKCHGTLSPQWGANNDTNSSCTKCHGKPTTLANYSTSNIQAAPGYGLTGLDLSRAVPGAFTNGVSPDPEIGAHDAHMRRVNQYTDHKVLCTDCHTVPTTAIEGNHLNGATDTELTWSSLAQNNGTVGTPNGRGLLTPAYNTGTGQCSANYCHGGRLLDGTNTAPIWNQTNYLTTYSKTTANCGKCHGSPPSTNPTYAHSGEITSWASNPATTLCNGCHGHEGNGPTHIDGTLQAGGSTCDSCHHYDTVGATLSNGIWSGGSWGTNSKGGANQGIEGWGAHAKHINVIKTRLGMFVAMSTASQFGKSHAQKVCGTCHTNNVANHTTGDQRTINFGDGNFRVGPTGTDLRFGATNPVFNGANNASSSTNPKTCSNVSCHYFTTPNWSAY